MSLIGGRRTDETTGASIRIDGIPVRVTPRRFRRIRRILERRQPDLVVCLEDVRNPHNVNAVLRTCDAVGVLTVHYVSPAVLPIVPGISRGAARWLCCERHDSMDEALEVFRRQGLKILATIPEAAARDYREVDYTQPCVLILGNEAVGVSTTVRNAADENIRIPMVGMGRSLNVSVAAAVILYEAFRQRERAGYYRSARLETSRYRALLKQWAIERTNLPR